MQTTIIFLIFLIVLIIFIILFVLLLVQKRSNKTYIGGRPKKRIERQNRYNTVGRALNTYARTLTKKDRIGLHPLNKPSYSPPKIGGAISKSKKKWYEYNSWNELYNDEAAVNAYMVERASVLNNPNMIWDEVLKQVNPLLNENREYIGIANLDSDGRTVKIIQMEASSVEISDDDSDSTNSTFASVPANLVSKYGSRPGLFIFHTHPADIRGSPLPSTHDLSTAVYFGGTSRFAANVVISRYGVIMFGIDWAAYQDINDAEDWELAVLNLSHDIVAAHESIRSWSRYTIQDYINFYPRYRLMFVSYPSADMVGDYHQYTFMWNLEEPIDYELINEHTNDILQHTANKKTRKGQFATSSVLENNRGFD